MASIVDGTSQAKLVNEATVLVRRYPNVNPVELDRMVAILPRLPVLDFALMMSDEELGPRLDQFTRSQRGRLRRPLKEIAGLLSPVALAALVIAWLVLFP